MNVKHVSANMLSERFELSLPAGMVEFFPPYPLFVYWLTELSDFSLSELIFTRTCISSITLSLLTAIAAHLVKTGDFR